MARVGINPRYHEDGEALRHREAHETFFGVEIENIEFVDPGRNDQQRPLENRIGRRRILNEFHEIVTKDDLSWGRRDIDTDFELRGVALACFERAFGGLHVLRQRRGATGEIVAARRPGFLEELGIGGEEIRWRKGARYLPQVEFCLVANMWIDIVRAQDKILGPMRDDGVRLPQEIEERKVPPFRSGEPFIRRVVGYERIFGLAGHPPQAMHPKAKELYRQGGLRFECPGGIAQPMFDNAADRTKRVGNSF